MTVISFTSHGQRIAGNLFTADKPSPLAFLLLHGWLGYQNVAAAQALATLGCTSMTYDMRGNGDSEGDLSLLTRADFLRDAAVAYDYFREQVGEHVNIGVVGSSFGSYIGILLSEKRAITCLSLRVPANYPDDGLHKTGRTNTVENPEYREWRERALDYSQNKALHALHSFKGNVQIIESEQDEQVPRQTVLNYVHTISDPQMLSYTVMAGAPHSLMTPDVQANYISLLRAWAQKQIAR